MMFSPARTRKLAIRGVGARGPLGLLVYWSGLILMYLVGAWLSWGDPLMGFDQAYLWFSLSSAIVYGLCWMSLTFLIRIPRENVLGSGFLSISVVFACWGLLIFFTRSYYSRPFMLSAYVFLVLWLGIWTWYFQFAITRVFAFLPGEDVADLAGLKLEKVKIQAAKPSDLPDLYHGVILDPQTSFKPSWNSFLARCKTYGLPFFAPGEFFEFLTGKVSLERFSYEDLKQLKHLTFYPIVRRLFDLGVVLLFAPIVIPILVVTMVCIKLDTKGPVLFWQWRVGQDGKHFKLLKVRSMLCEPKVDPRFTLSNDTRVTRVGRIIRKYRIDELPQFWNILKGEMSLIGPRPEQIPFVAEFENRLPYFTLRHLVKPGITGWAQVCQGYAEGDDETLRKIQFDLYYIKHLSPTLDLLILFKTIRTVLTGKGAR